MSASPAAAPAPTFSERMLEAGYFPKELPPPFTTAPFAKFCFDHPGYINDLWDSYTTQLVRHNLARPGTNRRLLGIPNPINQWRLILAIDAAYPQIMLVTKNSPISSSKPKFNSSGRRALTPHWYGRTFAEYRATARSGCRFIVRTDITRFYPSVYTHSIPWALHTKPVAKANRSKALHGNVIDKALREGQDGQTLGIPIGPDTSFLIGELILSEIDARVGHGLKGKGWRWFDDYEVGFFNEDEATAFSVSLERELAQYELEANATKTTITRLPQPLEDAWVAPIRGAKLNVDSRQQANALIELFSRAFEFAAVYPKSGVLKYAVKKLYEMVKRPKGDAPIVHHFQWELAQNLIAQVAVVEPDTLPTVLGLIAFYDAQRLPPDKKLLSETLCRVIEIQSQRDFASDVAWAVWGFIENGLPIPNPTAQMAADLGDDIVGLLMLDARSQGLVDVAVSFAKLEAIVSTATFESDHWLLAYESFHKGWLGAPVTNLVAANPHVVALHGQGVHFYREKLRKYESARHVFGTPYWLLDTIPYA